MDILAIDRLARRREAKNTVLHRPNGTWSHEEVGLLVNNLRTEASQLPAKPEYVILFGHYTKEQTLQVIGGDLAYTATPHVGVEKLPYLPSWI